MKGLHSFEHCTFLILLTAMGLCLCCEFYYCFVQCTDLANCLWLPCLVSCAGLVQAGVPDKDSDPGGAQRGGSERGGRRVQGFLSKGPHPRVYRRRCESGRSCTHSEIHLAWRGYDFTQCNSSIWSISPSNICLINASRHHAMIWQLTKKKVKKPSVQKAHYILYKMICFYICGYIYRCM